MGYGDTFMYCNIPNAAKLLYCFVVLMTMNQLRMFYSLGGAMDLYYEFGRAGS